MTGELFQGESLLYIIGPYIPAHTYMTTFATLLSTPTF